MERRSEDELAAVSEETKQARDIRARWRWVEPEVWTDRMLTALEQGVKGGQWFSLMDKVYSAGNLRQRLRSILRCRQGRRGVGHGFDHKRWTNAFFAEQGLFSLCATHASVRQSLCKVTH